MLDNGSGLEGFRVFANHCYVVLIFAVFHVKSMVKNVLRERFKK